MYEMMRKLAKWSNTPQGQPAEKEVCRLLAEYPTIMDLQGEGLSVARFLQYLREMPDKSGALIALLPDLESRQDEMTTDECIEFTGRGIIKYCERLMGL